MGRKPEKHMPYYHVLDALKKAPGCPICHLEHEGVRRYLDSLLYESVNDPDVRAGLARSKGYCGRHAHLLLSLGNGLGTAILYRDQVKLFQDFLAGMAQGARLFRRRKAADQWDKHTLCPACRVQMQERDISVSVLVAWLGEEEMRLALEASPGLCVPHFLLVLDAAKAEEIRRFLIAVERKKLTGILRELDEFCRKHDYRFSSEGFGKEGDSWVRALRLMVGRDGVF